MTKPFRPAELVVRVHTALRLRQLAAERGELVGTAQARSATSCCGCSSTRSSSPAFLVHDLKNPVNAIELHAQRVLRNATADERSRDAATQHPRRDARADADDHEPARHHQGRRGPARAGASRSSTPPRSSRARSTTCAVRARPRASTLVSEIGATTSVSADRGSAAPRAREPPRQRDPPRARGQRRPRHRGARRRRHAAARGRRRPRRSARPARTGVRALRRPTAAATGATAASASRSASSRSTRTAGGSGSRTPRRVRYSASGCPMLRDWNLPFRELVDAAPDGLVVCDERGVLVLVNAETERMFGYARDELLGKPIDMLDPRARARSARASHGVVRGRAAAAPDGRRARSARSPQGRQRVPRRDQPVADPHRARPARHRRHPRRHASAASSSASTSARAPYLVSAVDAVAGRVRAVTTSTIAS